jgi:hypothetical protein
MHKNNNQNWSKRAEKGLVSIFVVTVFMALLTLIVIGFAKIMNRELRQALDRELATQANFAVEAGMNDARAAVGAAIKAGTLDSIDTGGKCMDLSTLKKPFILNGSLSGLYNNDDSDKIIRYTCVIIQTQPKQLTEVIPRGQSKTYLISATTPLNSIYVGWQNKKDSNNPQPLASPYQLPKESSVSDDETGLLRATLYPVPNALGTAQSSDIQNAALSSASRTYFMYPNAAAIPTTSVNIPSVSYGPSNGIFVNGNCNAANRSNSDYLPFAQASGRYCNSKITGLLSTPLAPIPASATKNGNAYTSCTPIPPSSGLFPCTAGNAPGSTFSFQEYRAIYNVGNLPSGNYSFTLNYNELTDAGIPQLPPCATSYKFNVNVTLNGVTRNLQLAPPNVVTAATLNFSGVPASANSTVTITWTNNDPPGWVACGSNPNAWDPNFQINNFSLLQSVSVPGSVPVAPFYYLRLTALYQNLNVYVLASDATNNSLQLTGAQVNIDVTAQGNDVLKRERASVSVGQQSDLLYPNYALQSMDTLCKRLRLPKIADGSASSSYGNAYYNDPNETGSADVAAACSANGTLPPG